MCYRGVKALLQACAGVGALLAATANADAGGFAVREQSSWGQGASFAGVAAGGSSSAMFWNPATMTQIDGLQSNSVWSGIIPYASNSPNVAASTFGGFGGTGDTATNALVPAGYYTWQFRPDMWLGLSVTSPFGLSVNFPGTWAGSNYAAGSSYLKTYNATPSFAYRINDMISVGVGVQIQYAKADLSSCVGAPCGYFGAPLAELSGHDWGYGFTAGITWTPTPTTTIGIGYRSGINQKIDGTLDIRGVASFDINTTVNLPDTVSAGLRQRLTPQWTALATVEWANWSRIGTATVSGAPGSPILPFQYEDGWFFSLGAEYMWNKQLTLRGGVGYEKSPITDDVRMPLVPDNDRTWLSVGATYQWNERISLDFAYSHLFVKSTSINITAASGNPWFATAGVNYVGDVSSHVDVVSVGFHYRWDELPAPKPSLYTKSK
ncbi:MAG: OmpP1/FadL family transporter [Sphingobacteriales bacterium]